MSSSTNKKHTDEDVILDGIDNYKMTLGSMCALAHVLDKHYGAESRIAPAMQTRPRNKDQMPGPVTPDMLSQGRGVDLVVEVKRSLPGSKPGRIAFLDQIAKYDGDLTGWDNIPPTHDIMLMTHMSKSSQWADFIDEAVEKQLVSFTRKISVVEYVRDSERETYFILKKVWGETSNPVLDSYLHKSVVVRGEDIIKNMSVARFYDSKPDVAYTMGILWDQIFPALITKDEHLSTKGRKPINREIALTAIMDKVRSAPGSLFYPPRQAWTTEALGMLVRLKMAERRPGDRFLVRYKSIRGDSTRLFVKKLAKAGTRSVHRPLGDIREYFQGPA